MYNVTYMVAQDLTAFKGAYDKFLGQMSPKEIFKIVDFDFTTERNRNEKGIPYKSRLKALLHLSIEVDKNDSSRHFYDALSSRSQLPFTIFFCQGTSNGKPTCTLAAVFEGYVSNVQEKYVTVNGEATLTLGVDILMRTFNFVDDKEDIKVFQSLIQ